MDQVITIGLWGGVILLGASTALPSLPVAHGIVRSADFPRQQILGLALLLLPLVVWFGPPMMWLAVVILLGVAAAQIFQIGRYMPVWHQQSKSASDDELQTGSRISLMAANVKKSNREYGQLLSLVRDQQPDILMAIEVDQEWCETLEVLRDAYPHRQFRPMDNGYGMAILSKLKMQDLAFLERVTDGVPSFKAKVITQNGQAFRLHVIHPEPPVPNHDTKGRDAELGHIGIDARDDDLPVIVSGDLNDVAWSSNTRHFQQISQLLDPRVGRGFYNTFSATHPIMRWPLDQLFHDARFRFVNMERLGKIGSDHFPMLFEVLLTATPDAVDTPNTLDEAKLDDIKDDIKAEQKRDRKAIGSDWEDED